MLPPFVPPLVAGVAWTLHGSPNTGLINTFLARFGVDWRINLYSMSGIIFVFGMYYEPYVYMLPASALRNMDPSLEEIVRWPEEIVTRSAGELRTDRDRLDACGTIP